MIKSNLEEKTGLLESIFTLLLSIYSKSRANKKLISLRLYLTRFVAGVKENLRLAVFKKFFRRQISRPTVTQRIRVLISSILIVAFIISPIGFDQPKSIKAKQNQAIQALAIVAGACGLGMFEGMIWWSFKHGGVLADAGHNPEFILEMGISCAVGVLFIGFKLPGVKEWVKEVIHIATGIAYSEMIGWGIREFAEVFYEVRMSPYFPVIMDHWWAFYLATNPYTAVPFLMAESLKKYALNQESDLYDMLNDIFVLAYTTDTGNDLNLYKTVPIVDYSIIQPSNGRLYNNDLVSGTILYDGLVQDCADTQNGIGSEINYVQFGYSFTNNVSNIQLLPNNQSQDAKDYYGCNGWGFSFDIKSTGITSPTPIYLALRVEDIYGNLTPWHLSSPLIADPRYLHDYSVSNLQINPSSPNANQNAQVSATIQNLGASNEGSTKVTFYVNNQELSSPYIGALSAGASTTVQLYWTATQGPHTIRIQTNLNGDNNPQNNSVSQTIVVGTEPLLKVNGSITPSSYSISATTAGTSGSFSVSVQNVGSAPINVTVSKGGTRASWISITNPSFSLEANKTINYSFSINVPSGQPVGTQTAEIYFDWAGTRTILPVQFNISQYTPGNYTYNFRTSSGTVDGRIDFLYQPVMQLYKYLDNYSTTPDIPTYIDGNFGFIGDTFNRALEGCNWSVRGIENQDTVGATLYLSFNSNAVATKTTTFPETCFPIFSKLINGSNYWKISLSNFYQNANNVQWEVERNTISFTIVKGAWGDDSFKPGTSTVQTWHDGWDYGRVCGTVGTVTQGGDTDLYNNGIKVAVKTISASDTGKKVCWYLSSNEVFDTNYFILKPNGGTIFTISNMQFEVKFFTGQPSLQVVRTAFPQPAQVGQDITLTISVTNIGSNIVDVAEFVDSLPNGLQLVSGSVNSRLPSDIYPGQTANVSYVVRATTVGAFTIPQSTVIYEDYANNDYQTTIPATTIEVWGGTLQPRIDSISDGEVISPISISATVVDSLSGSYVSDATVLASIRKPNSSMDTVALRWNGGSNRFEASYYPTMVGDHTVTITASKHYYTSGNSTSKTFTVFPKNSPPIARIIASPIKGPSLLTVTLDGRSSIDTDGVIDLYQWDIDNNGSIDTSGATSQWVFSTLGTHTIKLIVTDNRNASATAITTIEVVEPLPPPTNLSATTESSTQIRLTWQDQSLNETRFYIERSQNENSGWQVIGEVDSNVTTYLSDGLACGSRYYYRIRAYRSSDGVYSAYSNISSAQTQDCPLNAPEIDVRGNSVSISNGDTTPSVNDHTDFGSVNVSYGSISRIFTIYNQGTGFLSLNGNPRVAISGENASDFTVSIQPIDLVPPDSSTSFTLTFNPSGTGLRKATISIMNNDPDENLYSFVVQGTGVENSHQVFLPLLINQ